MGALLEVLLQAANGGEFRMGPLLQQLAHHPALHPAHGAIAPVPVSHGQQAPRFEHPQELVGIALLVGHVGAGLHTPDSVKTGVRQLQSQGIHYGKAAAQPRWGQGAGPFDLGRADADPHHLEAVVAGKDSGAAADAAAHIQQR